MDTLGKEANYGSLFVVHLWLIPAQRRALKLERDF